MDREELDLLVPSETVRNYVMETGWAFTDKEKAALLFRSHCRDGLLLEGYHSRLRNLRDRTADEGLREEIAVYLERGEQAVQRFRENSGRDSVYALKTRDGEESEYYQTGYFFDWETAYAQGKKHDAPFRIEKYLAGESHPTADFCFDRNGEAAAFWSREIPDAGEDNRHFTRTYLEIPNPFEAGDIVRIRPSGCYGIVETSQKDWKERVERYRERLQQGDTAIDASDTIISVAVFEEEEGTFDFTDGVTPLDLERYSPQPQGKDWTDGSLDVVLLCAGDVYRGRGYLSTVFYYIEKYKRSGREIPCQQTQE